MWRLIKFLVWTSLSIWFGTFLATYHIGGRTPWQYVQAAWKNHAVGTRINSKVTDLKEGLQGALDSAQDQITGDAERKPKERHTQNEREALNKLIANRREK
jgi:hypothetical protein